MSVYLILANAIDGAQRLINLEMPVICPDVEDVELVINAKAFPPEFRGATDEKNAIDLLVL